MEKKLKKKLLEIFYEYTELKLKKKKAKKIIGYLYQENLKKKEYKQLARYLSIYYKLNFDEHWEVNNIIEKKGLWNDFKAIRSINDHGSNYKVPGVMPKYYAIVCNIIGKGERMGKGLIKAEPW